ncbi:MliC family protein [Brumimicrobium aurantiacum]|uniref:C-type lysozyme inhibitor domain-containing protein n=1 Tax=Brumimicrobium aurantiacum TaxID=1737063 RepID=A0A3E1EV23_9FLAO|nr:MliC family protein [Brumimicrobium aurantiacum]RFC53405.1 hypothetical protein DXU93_13315 [Brumimicrobium aurantiacum]
MPKIKAIIVLTLSTLLSVSCTYSPSAKTTISTEQNEDTVQTKIENEDGTLNILFDNINNTAIIQLNNGEKIKLKSKKPASGMWYANDQYELRGKGEHFDLYRNDKKVFSNQ